MRGLLRRPLDEKDMPRLTVMPGTAEQTASAAIVRPNTAQLSLPKAKAVRLGKVSGMIAGTILVARAGTVGSELFEGQCIGHCLA